MNVFGSGRGGWGGVVRVRWVTGLGLTNSGGTWRERDMCLCFGCGCVGGVRGEWMGRLGQGLGGWCYVYVCCEYGFPVFMTGPGICLLC